MRLVVEPLGGGGLAARDLQRAREVVGPAGAAPGAQLRAVVARALVHLSTCMRSPPEGPSRHVSVAGREQEGAAGPGNLTPWNDLQFLAEMVGHLVLRDLSPPQRVRKILRAHHDRVKASGNRGRRKLVLL